MNFKQFRTYAESNSAVPVSRRLLADLTTPVSLFLAIREGSDFPFLLESVEGGEQLARYSFLGRDPYQVLTWNGKEVELRKGQSVRRIDRPYFEVLRELTTAHTQPEIPELPRLTGGAVGFSSYDTVREIEALGKAPDQGHSIPEAVWAFYDEIIAFDHVKQQIVLIKTSFPDQYKDVAAAYADARTSLDQMEEAVRQHVKPARNRFSLKKGELSSNLTKQEFEAMVDRAKTYIYEGEIFQVVLSQRFEVPFEGDSFMLYRALRMVNPSPYLFFLDFETFSLIGSSPELLVRVQDRKVSLLPIAGTRPRGKDSGEDAALEKELLADPKEIAEHVMLVDLGRNDLSRVCEPGSVHVERNQVVERYSHVMHIVSDLSGEIRSGLNSVDALTSCFPAGTVSGAPKIRAMEIIDELEPASRGPYAGAVGYFDFSGNMDTCIAIRTMVATGENVYIQAGAGIVADSNPEKEFEETRNKAGALIDSLQVALSIGAGETPTETGQA